MPHLEAPISFNESSPDASISPDILDATPPPPAVISQIRLRSSESPVEGVALRLQSTQRPLQRNNTFDRDIPTIEEDNFLPTQPYLLPVILPQITEPTLDELLRRVTERNDLQNVEDVRLRVISYNISLSHLALFLPRLLHLDLSGSVLSSLRDLGYGLIHLSYLDVSNCGLNSFDGTSGLPAVRVLIADNNMIQRVGPLAELPLLMRLSAQNNRICDIGLLSFLGMCPNLIELDLQGNPVCTATLYRVTLQRSMPALQLLDGLPMLAHTFSEINQLTHAVKQNDSSSDAELSSLSSSEVCSPYAQSTSTDSLNSLNASSVNRPATAPYSNLNNRAHSNIELMRRPASATLHTNSLSFGVPVVGSVLDLARRNRQRHRHRSDNAWATPSNSTSSSSNISTRPPSISSSNSSFEMQSIGPPM